MTINKVQGQTVPTVGMCLPELVFSHGQFYVALSRGVLREYMGTCKNKHEHRSYWKKYKEYYIQRCLGIVRCVCATALYNRPMK